MKLFILISLLGLVFGDFKSYKEFSKDGTFKTLSDYSQYLGVKDLDQQFSKFKLDFKKSYGTEELEMTKKFNFLKSLQKIMKNNELFKRGKVTSKMGVGPFADMTEQEFRSTLTNRETMEFNQTISPVNKTPNLSDVFPESWDWRTKGVVTPVKNQGGCGSCWAFATVATVETGFIYHYNWDKDAVILSEQELVDCLGWDGCMGNSRNLALKYIQESGIHQSAVYPYVEAYGPCKNNTIHWKGKIKGFEALGVGAGTGRPADQYDIMDAVKKIGPVSTSFEPPESFQHYSGGIVTDGPNGCKPCQNSITCSICGHAVAIVGWGQEGGVPYWILKNSWGEEWGEAGYFRMERGRNLNGIEEWVYYPKFF